MLTEGPEGQGPLVVGLGGTLRSNSSTERALRQCLAAVERQGGRTKLYCGDDIDLPMYNPHEPARTQEAVQLIEALREADAVIVGSPGYHGGVSGLVKNALDYIEDMRADSRVYLDNKPWGCISCAYGWQAAVRHAQSAPRNRSRAAGLADSARRRDHSADQIWDEAGELIDVTVTNQLNLLASQVLTFVRSTPGQAAG